MDPSTSTGFFTQYGGFIISLTIFFVILMILEVFDPKSK